VSAIAVSAVRGALKTQALSKKVSLRPQTMLLNDNLHALEPAGHGGVVFRKIEELGLTVWEYAIAHVWTVRVMCPSFLWSCEKNQPVA